MPNFPLNNDSPPESESSAEPVKKIDFSLTSRILQLTIPIAMSGQLETFVGIAEIFMVGKLGPIAISALGISQIFTRVLGVSMIAVTRGVMTMIAQAIGAESMVRASAAAKQSFSLLFTLSIILSTVGLVISPYLLPALSLSSEVTELGTPYLQIFFLAMPFRTLNRAVTSCLHGAGDAKTPFYMSVLSATVHLLTSYLLIFGIYGLPQMGVTGAAVGQFLGHTLSAIVGIAILYSGRFGLKLLPETSYRFEWDLARRILRIGVPSGIQGLLRNGSGLVFVKLIALTSSSTAAVAAFAIGNHMERFLRRAALSYGTAATTLVGQSLGAKDPDRAESCGWTTLIISIATTILLSLPIVLFAEPIMAFFTSAPEVISLGVIYIYFMAVAEPFMCTANTTSGSLRGAGDTIAPMYYTLISQWLIRLPIAYILAFPLGYGINGIWSSLAIYSAIQGFLNIRRFAVGPWKTIEI